MNKSKKCKAYRVFMDSQKKVLARKYPFLSATQLHSKANEQWNILYKRKEEHESLSKTKPRPREKPFKKYHSDSNISGIGKKPTRLRHKSLSPINTTPDYEDVFANWEDQGSKLDLVKSWKDWDVNMWTSSGVATRRGYGGQSKVYQRKAPQIIEDEPWHNQHGILMNNKPEDEKKKFKCSVSFFDMAVTHHYPAMSPETPPSHKVFTFSAEERARIQKVLKRSQQQDAPVLKVASPVSVVSTSSEDDEEVRDSVLLKYNHIEDPSYPVFDKSSSVENWNAVVNKDVESNLPAFEPCTPQVDLALSPRVILAGLTPAVSVLPKSDSPISSSGSSLSSESAGIENAKPLSQGYTSSQESPVKKSPTKRKSPNSDIDKMANHAKSQKKSFMSSAARKVNFPEESQPLENTFITERVAKVAKNNLASCEPKKKHVTEMTKLYETMFGFLSDCSQGSNKSQSDESDNNVNIKQPQRTSPRKNNLSPRRSYTISGSIISNNLNTTPTRPSPTSCLSRTPFRTLVFDTIQDSLQAGVVGKPPTMPGSAKRNASRVKNGGVTKPSMKDNSSSSLTPCTSTQGLTPSRSSRRLLARPQQRSLNEPSENIDNYLDLNPASDFNFNVLQGSNVQQQTSSSKMKSLSRSNALTSLTSMQSENKLEAKPKCPPSPTLDSVRSSPRRSVLNSPRQPIRSSPRKSQSLAVLTDNKDVLNNNKVWTSASSESISKIGRKEDVSRNTVDDTVQKMRNVVYHETPRGFPDFLAGTRTPSELSDVSSIISGESERDNLANGLTVSKTSKNFNNLLNEVGRSVNLPVKGVSSRKPRSPTRNTTPGKTNQRRSLSWSAPRQPPSAGRRNRSATRLKSPKKAEVQEKMPLIPKLIVTEDDEVVQVNGTNAKDITKKQREDFLCNLFVDLTPPSTQPVKRRLLKSCGETSKNTFEQFLKGTGDADIFF